MPFKNIKIKTFELEDLKGRNIDVRGFSDSETELLAAVDTATGEFFILKEIHLPRAQQATDSGTGARRFFTGTLGKRSGLAERKRRCRCEAENAISQSDNNSWQHVLDAIYKDADKEGMTDMDAMIAWAFGLAVFKKARDYGAKFSHTPALAGKDHKAELQQRLKFVCQQLDDLAARGAYKGNGGGRGRLENEYDRLLRKAGEIEQELGL